jgi:hypothetical protein
MVSADDLRGGPPVGAAIVPSCGGGTVTGKAPRGSNPPSAAAQASAPKRPPSIFSIGDLDSGGGLEPRPVTVAPPVAVGEPRRGFASAGPPPRRGVTAVRAAPAAHVHGPRARDQTALAALLLITAALLIVAAFFLGVAAGGVFPSLRAVVSLSGSASALVPDVAAPTSPPQPTQQLQ